MAKRNLTSSKLSGSALLGAEESDPMGSMGNLMDVMLVFVCGLLIALIANWNVDLSNTGGSSSGLSVEELEGQLEQAQGESAADIAGYEELGTVYRDEETGTLYVVSPE